MIAVVRSRCPQFTDDAEVWDAFVEWRGEGEADYLRRIRKGGQFIFYSVLQHLYNFSSELCGHDISREVGKRLGDQLLRRHMPDVLQTTLVHTGRLSDHIQWLVTEFITGAAGEIYELGFETSADESTLRVVVRYRAGEAMLDYLRRAGHDPERAFANSFSAIGGAMATVLGCLIHRFEEHQITGMCEGGRGTLVLTFTEENRFDYENLIGILMADVRRLREQQRLADAPAVAEADVAVSKGMRATSDRMQRAAASDEIVLLCGESGTGKSYHARVMHDLSARSEGPFVEVGLTSDLGSDSLIQSNLFGHERGAFTGATERKQGLFALADGGTIFLDEIGDASPELQAKLLRVIETKTFKMLGAVRDTSVDVRIIVATNRDLADMVGQGAFREDLYYRLNVIQIQLPPLRERAEDIPGLLRRLFTKVCEDAGQSDKALSGEAFRILCAHDWPGNIRELENALRHAIAFSDGEAVEPDDLPEAVRQGARQATSLGNAGGSGFVVDASALVRTLNSEARSADTPTYEWPGHIDYAKREYLRTLIEHCGGRLGEIAKYWDRSSEHTLLKQVREFGLEGELREARRGGG